MCPRQSLVFRSTLIVEWETSQSTLLLSEKQVNPPYLGYVAISRLLYQIETTVPLTVKAKPTKNFSSKRKLPYHKIGRSACLSPPPFFLFKACTFYPCVSYFIFLWPLLNPLFFDTSPGGIKRQTSQMTQNRPLIRKSSNSEGTSSLAMRKCLPQ